MNLINGEQLHGDMVLTITYVLPFVMRFMFHETRDTALLKRLLSMFVVYLDK